MFAPTKRGQETSALGLVAAAVLVLAVGYYIYSQNVSTPTDAAVFDTTVTSQIVGQDILALVEKLRTVSLNPAIFSSTLFNNLRDYSIPINPEARGRPNPFAPIGVDR